MTKYVYCINKYKLQIINNNFVFLDGKFILELARSKDGEKGGWVSVPRKIFRTPSAATSSTVTPSATASTSAGNIPSPLSVPPTAVISGGVSGGVSYPKNECSNSLSCKFHYTFKHICN